jgi:hypothetical protein
MSRLIRRVLRAAGYPSAAVSEQDNVHREVRGRPRYEVWFLTFTDPSDGAGYWIRSTTLAPKRGSHSAGIWFARFDPGDPGGTFGIHGRSEQWSISTRAFDVRIGTNEDAMSVMTSGHAEGTLRGDGHSVSWSLEYATGGETWRLLPDALYRGSIAPTKPFSPNPRTRFSGTIDVDGRRSTIIDAPGQQGHLFGSRHAERWAWAHCSGFEGEDVVVHALTAQGRRGPLLTPFVTSIGVLWQGRWVRLTKLGRRRDFGLGSWRVDLESRRYRLTGRIEAPARGMIRARYEDPDGTWRHCHNSEIASARLALFERRTGGFEEIALLDSRGTTHAEWAGRTPAAAVAREFIEVPA